MKPGEPDSATPGRAGTAPAPAPAPLALWGGVECTVNRVGDGYLDQIERSGHALRLCDLDRFAELGVQALRYPVLWERTAPGRDPREADFSWADERLHRLRALGVRPIVGLVHHGSGPRHTSLLDPAFPQALAVYARRVAEQYPWVEDYTPVNEPLTTARFSGLYGHWYPHRRSAEDFVRALLHQCKATVLAMRAVREVNPRARLIQTEDFGKTYSTPALAYQARHENHRRLLSIDLLCGRIGPQHPLYEYLLGAGATERELAFFQDTACAPDVIGVNYYVTSDRFLDERLDRYPPCCHGGNHRQRYADVEAARVRAEGLTGHLHLLHELAERYGRPLAITEAHLGGAREEQLRWFLEAWGAAQTALEEGVSVLAVTAWSLLGAFDWDCLVTRDRGCYEPGAFDVRTSPPRPTAVASMLRALGSGAPFCHPVTGTEGWWRRPVRLAFPEVSAPKIHGPGARDVRQSLPRDVRQSLPRDVRQSLPWDVRQSLPRDVRQSLPRDVRQSLPRDVRQSLPRDVRQSLPRDVRRACPLLIAGATGTLGRAFGRVCALRGLPYRLLSRAEMDIADSASVRAAIERIEPWAVINAAGYVRVDEAEREKDRCTRENVSGPRALAAACAERGVPLVTFSSDLVFSGAQSRPYVESDLVAPLGVYGHSKALGEREVMSAHPGALIVRTGAFFGPWDEHNFVTAAVRALSEGRPLRAASDAVVSPTYVPDLVNATLDLLVDGASGLWHIANRGEVTWADLARRAAELAGLDPGRVVPCPTHALGLAAPRPAYSALGTQRGVVLPALEESLSRYLREREPMRADIAAA